jgi:DNA-binding GntR family transcriptional regulator
VAAQSTTITEPGIYRGGDHSVTRQIYRKIKSRIISGELAPGTRMSEASLATEYGVSRTPVREALKLLSTEGYVVIAPQIGSVVSRLNREDVLDAVEMRAILEPVAASQAAARADEELYRALQTILDDLEVACAQKNYPEILRADDTFHRTIWQATHNRRLVATLEAMLNLMDWARWHGLISDPMAAHLPIILEQHRRIYDAIRYRQPEQAQHEMTTHMDNVRRQMMALGESPP